MPGARIAGVRGVAGKYVNKSNLKKLRKKVRKGMVGALGATTMATVGAGIGLATGDFGNVFKYGGAAGAVGYGAANKAGDKLLEIEKENREAYKENKWGTDEYNTRNSIKELNSDPEFRKSCKAAGLDDKKQREAMIRMFHANGITSSDSIAAATKAMAQTQDATPEEAVAAAQLSQGMTKSYWGNPQNRIKFKQDLMRKGVSSADADRAEKLISGIKGDLG